MFSSQTSANWAKRPEVLQTISLQNWVAADSSRSTNPRIDPRSDAQQPHKDGDLREVTGRLTGEREFEQDTRDASYLQPLRICEAPVEIPHVAYLLDVLRHHDGPQERCGRHVCKGITTAVNTTVTTSKGIHTQGPRSMQLEPRLEYVLLSVETSVPRLCPKQWANPACSKGPESQIKSTTSMLAFSCTCQSEGQCIFSRFGMTGHILTLHNGI